MVKNDVNKEMMRVMKRMEEVDPGSKEHHDLIKAYSELDKIKIAEEESDIQIGINDQKMEMAVKEFEQKMEEGKKPWYRKFDPNVLLSAGVSLVSIFSILNYEKFGVITSKAFSFMHRPKLK